MPHTSRRSRFIRESEAAGALTHPNMVTIYDVGDFEGAPYIMMELLEGKTLGELMITGKKAFDAESMPTLIMQIVQKTPLPIRQISKDTPVGLQKIVTKLLQKKPERCSRNGKALKSALARLRQDLLDEKTGAVWLIVAKGKVDSDNENSCGHCHGI